MEDRGSNGQTTIEQSVGAVNANVPLLGHRKRHLCGCPTASASCDVRHSPDARHPPARRAPARGPARQRRTEARRPARGAPRPRASHHPRLQPPEAPRSVPGPVSPTATATWPETQIRSAPVVRATTICENVSARAPCVVVRVTRLSRRIVVHQESEVDPRLPSSSRPNVMLSGRNGTGGAATRCARSAATANSAAAGGRSSGALHASAI